MTIRTRLAASAAAALALALALVPAAAAHAVPLPTGSLSGVVRDGTGAVVANADVELSSGSHSFSTASDATGAFSFAAIPAGEYFFYAEASGPHRPFAAEVLVPSGGAATLDPLLGLPSTVHGTVTGPGGTPLEHVVVRVSETDGTGGVSNGGSGTAANGAFSFDIDPGEYTVSYVPPPGSDLEYEWFDGAHDLASADKIQAPLDGTGDYERSVQLQENTTQITGEVWLNGAVQPGAFVVLQNWNGDHVAEIWAQTGTFSTAGVPAGEYSLFARFSSGGEYFVSQTETVTVGAGDVQLDDLVLAPEPDDFEIHGVADAYEAERDTVLGVPTAGGVLANDSMTPPTELVAVIVDEPTHGEIFLQYDGAFTYAPEDGFVGTDTFTYSPGPEAGFFERVTVTIEVREPTPAGGGGTPASGDVLPATGGGIPAGAVVTGLLALGAGLGLAMVSRGRAAGGSPVPSDS